MIREEAARQLAQDLLAPYILHGLANQEIIEGVARLIMSAVRFDEELQSIEANGVTRQ